MTDNKYSETKKRSGGRLAVIIMACAVVVLALMGCQGGTVDNKAAAKEAEARRGHLAELFNNNQTDSTLIQGEALKAFCKKHELWDTYFITWNYIASTYFYSIDKQIAEARAMFKEAKQLDNMTGKSLALLNLSSAYFDTGDIKRGKQYAHEVIDMLSWKDNDEQLNTAYFYYTQFSLNEKRPDTQELDHLLREWKKGIDGLKRDEPYYYALYYQRKAGYLSSLKKYDQALAALDTAKYYTRQYGWGDREALDFYDIEATIKYENGDYAAALKTTELMRQYLHGNDNSCLYNWLVDRKECYVGLKQWKDAYYITDSLLDMSDLLTAEENKQQVNALSKQYETDKLQMQMQIAHQRFAIAAILVVVLLAALGWTVFYIRRIRQKNRALYEKIVKLQKEESTKEATVSTEQARSPLETLYHDICRLMTEERLFTNPDLNRSDVARKLGTNDHYVGDAIREFVGGQTFTQFVMGYRLRYASQLLIQTSLPIEQVAFDTGFNNRQSFFRSFKGEYGMTPSDFRRASM